MPNEAKDRKKRPIITGVFDYFPDALTEIAFVSFLGNEQHNPGEPLHWSREKSNDHVDCMGRHLLQRYERDTDGAWHFAKAGWRLMADFQLFLEAQKGK
jgi:hypothetical protein